MENKQFFVEVRIDNGSLNDPTHAFIVLTDEFGNKQGFGFAPINNFDLWGPGEIGDDTKHPYNHSLPYEVTQQQYEDLLSYIYQQQQNP